MAAGDLNGDLRDAYLTPEQRAAKLAGKASTGPVGRATQQLASLPAVARPPSLADASPAAQQAAQASSAPAGLDAQADQSGQPKAQDISADQYRTLTAGLGSAPAPIAARVGANGVPEFSNQPADLRSALTAAPISNDTTQQSAAPTLANAMPTAAGMRPANFGQGTGSLSNLGDGIGTFSQANAGDSQIAMGRFARAADIRDAGRDKDRLDLANARLARDANFTVVADSSKRPTLADLRFDQQRQADTQAMQESVKGAQAQIDNRRQGQSAELQLRQATRLDDIMRAATAPNATPEARAAYLAATDPTGEKALSRQLTQANIGKVTAEGRAADAKSQSLSTGLDGQLKQLEIEKRQGEIRNSAKDREISTAGSIASIDQALGSVSAILGSKNDAKGAGGANSDEDPGLSKAVGVPSMFPTIPGSNAADFEQRNETLKAQTFLPQVAALKGLGALSNAEGEKLTASIASLSVKQSPEAYRKNLGIVRDTFQLSRSRLEKGNLLPVTSSQQQSAGQQVVAATDLVRANSPEDVAKLPSGALFIAPDGSTRRKP